MKVKPTQIRKFSIFAGLIFSITCFTSVSHAQSYVSSRSVDLRSPLSQDILQLLTEKCPDFAASQWEQITKMVQIVSMDSGVPTGMILALMEGEESYAGYPQTRLYYFNLDTGLSSKKEDLPSAWLDAERVARSYKVQKERYESMELAVAAYFIGKDNIPAGASVSSLNDGMKEIVGLVMTKYAAYSHLGERKGPQIVETSPDTPVTSYERPEQDFTEIQKAYINNMMVFNPKLKYDTAVEIFNAIARHAETYPNVDARLVMSLVACESSFRPDAVSHAGAQGLGQLMPFTAERFGVSNPFDIDENIRATFGYLDREINRWSGYNYQLDRILAAYNAGPGAVEKYSDAPYNGVPPYDETRNYVRKVVFYYFHFLPEKERAERLLGKSRHIFETNGIISVASK